MADCKCLTGCPFFHDRMENMPGMADMYKRRYCQGSSADCARHMVFRTYGKSEVPSDLFPNEVEKAQAFIEQRAQTA